MAMGHKPNREPFQKGIAFSTQCSAMADAVHCVRNGKTDTKIYTPIPDK